MVRCVRCFQSIRLQYDGIAIAVWAAACMAQILIMSFFVLHIFPVITERLLPLMCSYCADEYTNTLLSNVKSTHKIHTKRYQSSHKTWQSMRMLHSKLFDGLNVEWNVEFYICIECGIFGAHKDDPIQ